MKLEVLIATMNRRNIDFLEKMNVMTDAIVINQCDEEKEEQLDYKGNQIKVLCYKERGLSKSRNRALEASTADICLVADDDVKYQDDYSEKIINAYKEYPDADLIAFQMIRTGSQRLKKFRTKASKQNWISCMKISSVEMTFKRSSIEKKGIRFNPLFGAGAYFNNGEENIFLYECLRRKLKIIYVPIVIGSVCCDESSWFEGYDAHYFESMGAGYYGMSHTWGWLLSMQHLVRHYKLYKEKMSFLKVAHHMKKGKELCKRMQNSTEGKKKVFIVGDFNNNNGPALVNQNLKKVRGKESNYSVAKTKVGRIIELLWKSINADVIVFSGLSQINKIGIRWARLLHKPTAYLMHGYVKRELQLENQHNERLIELEKYMLTQADQIITVSRYFKQYIKGEVPQVTNKLFYVDNGINWEIMKENNRVDEIHGEYIIMSIGGGLRIKNNLEVCRAIDKIKDKLDRPIKYIIVGQEGRDSESIRQYDFVEYLGQISHIDVLKRLGQADLYVQNSYFESFSLATIEALLSGCNLLISNNVGVLSILNNVTSFDLIENIENAEEIAEKIIQHLKEHNHERLISSINKSDTSWVVSSKNLTAIVSKLYIKD